MVISLHRQTSPSQALNLSGENGAGEVVELDSCRRESRVNGFRICVGVCNVYVWINVIRLTYSLPQSGGGVVVFL